MSTQIRQAIERFLSEAKAKGSKPGDGWINNDQPMMKCGCAGIAVKKSTGEPTCLLHQCDEVADDTPDLTDRVATCQDCGKMALSSPCLPFFRFRGPGAENKQETDSWYCGCWGGD